MRRHRRTGTSPTTQRAEVSDKRAQTPQLRCPTLRTITNSEMTTGVLEPTAFETNQFDCIVDEQHAVHGNNRNKHTRRNEHAASRHSINNHWHLIELDGEPLDDRGQIDEEEVSTGRLTVPSAFEGELRVELGEKRIADANFASVYHDAGSRRPRSRMSSSPRLRSRSTSGAGNCEISSTMLARTTR